MPDEPNVPKQPASAIPPDNLQRNLAVAQPNTDQKLSHIGVVGDTYTILLTGKDTAGRFCLIDMHIAPGGGPPPHRHDFEETFSVLEGELEATFRGTRQVVRAGETINVPANAPHQFHNSSSQLILSAGENALHLFTVRPGGILYGDWCSGRNPHDASTQA